MVRSMKILTNTLAISGEILDIINHAKRYIYIMSPFVQLEKDDSPQFFMEKIDQALKNALQKHIRIQFIAREEKEEKKNISKSSVLEPFIKEGCELFLIPNLHAKIYCNESKALITSMNLYLHSVLNNPEIGVLLDKEKDLEIIKDYIENLIRSCQKISKEDVKSKPWKDSQAAKGHCVICGTKIDFNPELKFLICEDCTDDNKQYSYEYEGEFCHMCGNKGIKDRESMPLCKNCYYQFQLISQYESWYSNNY